MTSDAKNYLDNFVSGLVRYEHIIFTDKQIKMNVECNSPVDNKNSNVFQNAKFHISI